MPLTEHNWERFFQQATESKEKMEKNGSKEKIKEDSSNKEKQEKEPPRKKIKISPKDAHRIALILIKNKDFKDKLKEYVAEKIVCGESIAHIDVIIEESDNKQLCGVYGMTKEHFKDIASGNLTSFDLTADGPDLAIYFKRATGESAIRPINNKKLADLLNSILNVYPEFVLPDIQSDVQAK